MMAEEGREGGFKAGGIPLKSKTPTREPRSWLGLPGRRSSCHLYMFSGFLKNQVLLSECPNCSSMSPCLYTFRTQTIPKCPSDASDSLAEGCALRKPSSVIFSSSFWLSAEHSDIASPLSFPGYLLLMTQQHQQVGVLLTSSLLEHGNLFSIFTSTTENPDIPS